MATVIYNNIQRSSTYGHIRYHSTLRMREGQLRRRRAGEIWRTESQVTSASGAMYPLQYILIAVLEGAQ
jgi:hypothetical protein